MSTFLQDLRYALRVLRKTPGFSLAAIVVLAVGIGVNTAVFSFVNALVLKPLMGRDRPGEVVGVYSRDTTRPDAFRDFSYDSYADIRDRNTVFSDVMAFTVGFAGLREGDATTRRTLVATVTGNYFSTLGVALEAGRTFTREEERPGAGATVAVVSHEYWKGHGADRGLLGKSVSINAQPFTVVGIAPAGFTGTVANLAPEVWVPTGTWELLVNDRMRTEGAVSLADRRNEALMVVGRLKPGVSQDAAVPALRQLSLEMQRAFPAESRYQDLLVRTLPRLTISSAPQSEAGSMGYSVIVMAMAAIVLLIAGMNLANMVMARNTARQKEIAMRVALGGTRGRIVRQLLTEGFVLSVLGGAGGLLVSYWATGLLWSSFLALSPIPMRFDPAPDVRVLLATLAFCAFATVVFGLGPAWRLSRLDVWRPLKAQGSEEPERRRRRWSARDMLVAAQVALSLALLTAAGLFVRGAHNAASSDPGYRLEHRAVATIDASLAGYGESSARPLYSRLLERVRALPGVESASSSSLVAFSTMFESTSVRTAGAGPHGRASSAVYAAIGTGYFRTLGLPILRGRDFTAGEEQEMPGARIAIVDQPLAVRLFEGADPVGRTIEAGDQGAAGATRLVVVGVVPGVRQSLWDKAPVPHFYVPSGQLYRAETHFHVRLAAGTRDGDLLQAIRREVRAVDERLPVLSLKTLEEHRDTTTTYWAVRTMAAIFSTFGALALLLALVGVYALKAYLVARRTREIGIRIALGSTPARVLRLVMAEGLGLTVVGLGVGFLLALVIGRLVGSVLYQVSPFDPLTFGAAPLVLAAASLLACYLPARRATRIPPVSALRAE